MPSENENLQIWRQSRCEYPKDLEDAIYYGWSDITWEMGDVIPVRMYDAAGTPSIMAIDIELVVKALGN